MIAVGALAAFIAAICSAFAIVLQATEAQDSKLTESAHFSVLLGLTRRPRWLLGTSLLIAAWPLQVLALSFAPITIVQPILASFQLVLLGIARVQLRERVGPREAFAAAAIVVGLVLVLLAAPRHTVVDASAARLAVPLVIVGVAALLSFLIARASVRHDILLVVGAGLGYAWVDFVNKLLSNDISSGQWLRAALWLAATLAVGGLAFLQENTALARRPAVTVGPVIGAVQEPLPVLMALAAGVETWRSEPWRVGALVGGLGLVAAGATALGRSRTVARVSTGGPVADPGAIGASAPS